MGELITSRQNRLIRHASALGRDGGMRREEKLFLCEGARLCRDAALSGVEIETCFYTRGARRKYEEYLAPVLKICGESYLIEDHVSQLLSGTKTPQGVFCVCRWPQTLQGDLIGFMPHGPCLVLENLQDPGNLGTVLRTAEAFGVFRVFLLGNCCDPLSPKALRASMGAVFRVGLTAEPSPRRLEELLRRYGYRLHAAVPDSAARPVTEIDFSAGLHAMFIGNEGSGLTGETIALCNDRVTIPMEGRAESLNASAAATVLLWEMARRKGGERNDR